MEPRQQETVQEQEGDGEGEEDEEEAVREAGDKLRRQIAFACHSPQIGDGDVRGGQN
jgi:hypothetical protein